MSERHGNRIARFRLRPMWLKVHLWLGLWAGAVWVLMGLTGAVNVFRWDIDEWLNPELIVTEPGETRKSLDEILAALRAAHPERNGIWSLEMPRHPAGMILARQIGKKTDGSSDILFVSVNPYTAEIVANRFYADFSFLITWIYDLHSTFFLGSIGSNLAGVFGLLLMITLAIGVYLWWPRGGKWHSALTFKRGASPERAIFDIHKLCGIYGLAVLFTIAFSGTCLVFRDYVQSAIALVSPIHGSFSPAPAPPEGLKSIPSSNVAPITLEHAVTVAESIFPDAQVRFVKTPDDPEGFYAVQMRQPGEASLFFTTTTAWVDQFSGEVLAVRDPNTFTAGETFLNLMWPLHNGEALGLPGRILVCMAGFVPLVLYVTGLIRWLQKRKAARRVERRFAKTA
ncbi:PepSY-associated TM helix domain-containing protein [Methylocaldum szegediense]|uniref:PepSY-associated TM helix family n=1 Tax=Methylocaldum szegediense TaxID=73780 RepID=A0ABM9I126_9GAMM|nr:PepSY-associated TM helix domain-containing protein [Methylocaldum szegediense]CAI8820062.1 PepSY-associated TM helix family [Methylocaldum szegediense]